MIVLYVEQEVVIFVLYIEQTYHSILQNPTTLNRKYWGRRNKQRLMQNQQSQRSRGLL